MIKSRKKNYNNTLKYVFFFLEDDKKITFICIVGVSLVILVNLIKERLYELAENLEFIYRRHFGQYQGDRSASFENKNRIF